MTQKELLTVLSALGSADEAEWRPAYERLLACDPRLFMDVEKIFKLPQLSDYPARNRFADFLFALPAEDVGFNVSLTNGRNEELTIVTHEDGLRLTFKVHVGDGSGKTIEAYRGVSRDEGFTTETMRLMKSLLLLASFDTRESGEIIMTVASGHPKAMLTKLAQALINERKNPSARESLSNLWDDLPVGGNFELLKIPPTQTILQSLVQSHVSPAYAMIRLTKEPDAATQFIGEKLHPAEMSPEQFELLLEQLASDDETRWRDAFNKLHIFNRVWELEEIESLLAREQFQSYPARHRLVDLITLTPLTSSQSALRRRYKVVTVVEADGEDKPRFVVQCGPDDRFRGSSSIYWTEENERTAMSLLLLDSFKTSRAKEILQLMASGHPKASITQFARSILDSNQPDLTR
ncbi:hypothetical protein LOC67_22865 [Stieleria sp. JC731]|uniref:hypothetical protein n=1 Tax=Pirellulaceae TaxID=2691357 RepID=UPI001E45F2FA|nr:hypothetical protein [Stieleria sp. JC731]MCC9603402.1 hypothetical protein [Stieleria sp. JC731]